MDWASDDYSLVYADTFLTPAPGSDAGIYLLDETDDVETDGHSRDHRGCLEPPCRRGGSAPIYRGRAQSYGPKRPRLHEGYYTGGNIISDRNTKRAVHGVAWDERRDSGADWDRLIPPHSAHHGPAPFPLGADGPDDIHRPGAEYFSGPGGGGHHCGCDYGRAAELKLQYLKVFLLIIVVILLAMTLVAAGRLTARLEKIVGPLGAVAVGGRSEC